MESIPCQSTDLVVQLHIVKPVGNGNRIKLDVAASNFTLFLGSIRLYNSLQLYGQRNLFMGLPEKIHQF